MAMATMANASFAELLNWRDEETANWRRFFIGNPHTLDLACDIAGTKNLRELVQHIFAVELRYAERLLGSEVTAYEDLDAGTLPHLFAIGDKASQMLRRFAGQASDAEWSSVIEFATRTAGTRSSSRRKIFIHALMHGVRHWAQLATLLRERGFSTGYHDLLFSKTME